MKARRILVGVDGSVGSDRALRWSIELARELDAEIVAVHVLELRRHPINLVRFIEVGEVSDKALGDEMQATFEVDWCAPLHDAGVTYRTILAGGTSRPGASVSGRHGGREHGRGGVAWARKFHRATARERDPCRGPSR